jgi:nicotinic acid mononucleotide adenylyltransferase
MKSFLEVVQEENSGGTHHVFTYGRMNPPTTGHLKLIDKVKEVAAKHNAGHTVITSHSQDKNKNPLSAAQKIKHLKRYSPSTNFKSSDKEHPSFLHQAAKLHKQGVTHLHMVVGSDRVKEMKDKVE